MNDTLKQLEETLASFQLNNITPQKIQRELTSYYSNKDLSPLMITTGLYFFHMKRWMKHFNQGNLLIIDGERFLRDPGSIIEEVQDFLRLPKLIWKEDFAINPQTGYFCYLKITKEYWMQQISEYAVLDSLQCLNDTTKGRTRKKSHDELSESTLVQLRNFYKPYNDQFFNLISKKFDWEYYQ